MSRKSLASLSGLNLDLDALEQLPERERELARAELLQLEEAFRENPLLGYRPHAKQILFHSPPFVKHRCFFGGNRSHVGSTLVRMADGSAKEIEKVRRGERVVGADLDGNCRPVDVLDVFCNGFAACERFTFGRGNTSVSLVATPEHRVLARMAGKSSAVRPLGDVRDRWSCVRGLGFEPEGDGILEEWAFLLGLLLGDGSFTDAGDAGRRLAFHNTEPSMMALVAGECDALGLRVSKRGPGTVSLVAGERVPRGWFQDFAADVLELACRAHEKAIPEFVSAWSNEAVGRLLAGLFLTDGWVDADGRGLGIQLTSWRMINQIRDLLEMRFGVYGREITCREYAPEAQRDGWTLKVTSLPCIRRFAAAVPMTGRKRARLDLAPELMRYEKDKRNLRLLERAPVGQQLVWDLKVDHPDSMFLLANGMITHNSGKTTSAVADSVLQAVDDEFVPEHLRAFRRWGPPFFCRFVTPDLGHTLHGVLLEKIREFCPASQLKGGTFDRAWDKQLRLLRFKNGSWFQFLSSDQDRDKHGGTALHRVVFDEEPPKGIRDENIWRLVDFDGDEIFAMTPFSGMSWLYEDFFEPWERGQLDPDSKVVIVDIDENPYVSERGKQAALVGLTAEERQARKSGRFVHFAGLIYPEFSREKHVLPTPPPEEAVPAGSEVFCGIDPGWRHMAAVVYCYLDFDATMVVFDEIALRQSRVSQVCDEIALRNQKWDVRPRWYVIDPSSRNMNAQTGRSDQQEFADHGIYTIPGQNRKPAGINNIKERLQADPPRLLVMAHCHELLGEFKRYRWQSQGRGEHDAKEETVKKDDHLLDALRYVCMQRPLTPDHARKQESMTALDRALRADLQRLSRPRVIEHESGPGIFAG